MSLQNHSRSEGDSRDHPDGSWSAVQRKTLDNEPISPADLRAIIAILAEVSGMLTPLPARRRALMDRLCPLLNADRWIWTTTANVAKGRTPTAIAASFGGFTEREFGIVAEASYDEEEGMPENPRIIDDVISLGHITRTRSDWLPDSEFYQHPTWVLYRQAAGSDHYMFSLFPLGNGFLSGIGIHRLPGEPDFTVRERRILHLVASQVSWLHRADLVDEQAGDLIDELSPRLRTVFTLLLQGWNRKQIASHLGIRPSTVASYIKNVYRHFGVKSQAQLLTSFVRGDGGDTAIH